MTALFVFILSVFNTILIPVQYRDTALVCSEDEISALAGRISDYFTSQMEDGSEFHITATQKVTLDKNLSYYGANTVEMRDRYFYEAVMEACLKVNGSTDFSTLDNNGDGSADMVLLLSAGGGEDGSGNEDEIWPHSYTLSEDGASLSLNGVIIGRYAVCNEMRGREIEGIGKMCHEIGHCLGLPDFYDTDGDGSGGLYLSCLDSLSLMSRGYALANGTAPCRMNAVERKESGLARTEAMTKGGWTLSPGSGILELDGDNEGEYFLVECIDGPSLAIHHIDRSDNDAGWSDRNGRIISAKKRWSDNEVNCNPDNACAEASPVQGSWFCNFVFRNGARSNLSIENIRDNGDGSISFEVCDALSVSFADFYQDGAAIRFHISERVGEHPVCRLDWIQEGETLFSSEPARYGDEFRFVLDKGLSPSESYCLRICIIREDGSETCFDIDFRTRYYRSAGIPFIYLNGVERNPDGSIPAGTEFPLKVYNMPDAAAAVWYFNGSIIKDPWFTATVSGELKVETIREDGSIDTTVKKITVK